MADTPAGGLRTADLLGALSVASDLAAGLPAEHALRSCYIGMRIADHLTLSAEQRADLYYAELLMDVGCTAWTSQVAASVLGDDIIARRKLAFETDTANPSAVFGWLLHYMAVDAPLPTRASRIVKFAIQGKDFMREGFKNTCEVAERFATRLGMSPQVQKALASVFEQWDGSGPYGRQRDDIPLISRIVYASSFLEVFHGLGGRDASLRLAQKRRGKAFDPMVVDAFLAASQDEQFWQVLDGETAWHAVLSLEPDSPYRYVGEERLREVALSFADFADLKAPHAAGHSRRVSELSERLARRMGLPEREVETIRTAALVHDLGLVAVPSFTLQKPPDTMGQAERESIRLHPYHGERILARIPAMRDVAHLVGAHHERANAQGYYRGLAGPDIPTGARIIAVADLFDELTHETPGQEARDPDAAVERMRDESAGLEPRAVQALAEEVGVRSSLAPLRRDARHAWPAGLTDREIDVLRLLAKGMNRRDIARSLVVSEGTVRSHLEHIYGKIGVSTQVAAVLFALEQHLLD